MKVVFLDVEATDLGPKARLVQLAYKDAESGAVVNEFFKPATPIAYGAMAVHHITNEMVADKPDFASSATFKELSELLKDRVLVAHNAAYDVGLLKTEGILVPHIIDTLRAARHLLESERYGLQYLRYFLNLGVNGPAHDAAADIAVLEKLFERLCEEVERAGNALTDEEVVARLQELTNTPVMLKHFQFGKHKGKPFDQVAKLDPEYLNWLLRSETQKLRHDQDEDLVYTLKQYVPLTWENS